jgi:hypothetical protein
MSQYPPHVPDEHIRRDQQFKKNRLAAVFFSFLTWRPWRACFATYLPLPRRATTDPNSHKAAGSGVVPGKYLQLQIRPGR